MSWPNSHEYFPALARTSCQSALVGWPVEAEVDNRIDRAGLTCSNFIDSCLFSMMRSYDGQL